MEVIVATSLEHSNISWVKAALITPSKEVMRKSCLERLTCLFDLFDFILGKADLQGRDILFEMLDLATTGNWTDVRSFVHDIRQCNARNTSGLAGAFCDLAKNASNTAICIARGGHGNPTLHGALLHGGNTPILLRA